MTTQVSISPYGIQFFLNNQGEPNVGGSVLTQVGGINYATYQDSAGTIPLPNPIPLNARGEISNSSGVSCQLFLVSGVTYTFTLYDAAGNQLNQAAYVTPPAVATQTSPFTESTIAVSQSVALVDSGTVFICTAALTLTVAQTSLLNKSWFVTVYAYGGAVTVTPYSTDMINGGTAGAAITIPQDYIANIYTDGQGNLYCNVGTSVANATNAVNLVGSGNVPNTTTLTGITNGSAIAAGMIGEVLTATLASGSAVSLTNGVTATVTSQSVTAGLWLAFGVCDLIYNAGTQFSQLQMGFSTVAATLSTNQDWTYHRTEASAIPGIVGTQESQPIPNIILNLASTTTVYMVTNNVFGAGTMAAYGSINFVRLR